MSDSPQSVCPVCETQWMGQLEKLGRYELHVCPSCGIWYYDDVQSIADYDEIYNNEQYQAAYVSKLAEIDADPTKLQNITTYASFFGNVPFMPNGRLLDVGCGVGIFVRAAMSVGWHVTGIDVSKRAIRAGNPEGRLDMRCSTVETLEDATPYDAVTCFEVLEHLSHPRDFLCKISTLVKSGGYFFCTVPNLDSYVVRHATRPDWLPPVHRLFFNEAGLRLLLHKSGLHDVKVGRIVLSPRKRGKVGGLLFKLRRLLQGRPVVEPVGLWGLGIRS
jgi:2-polyprenyl-3-methyl-5-hydroxy-6-metoxy-1,4-benzoquinol methylase